VVLAHLKDYFFFLIIIVSSSTVKSAIMKLIITVHFRRQRVQLTVKVIFTFGGDELCEIVIPS
jgi:hypothetical protein